MNHRSLSASAIGKALLWLLASLASATAGAALLVVIALYIESARAGLGGLVGVGLLIAAYYCAANAYRSLSG